MLLPLLHQEVRLAAGSGIHDLQLEVLGPGGFFDPELGAAPVVTPLRPEAREHRDNLVLTGLDIAQVEPVHPTAPQGLKLSLGIEVVGDHGAINAQLDRVQLEEFTHIQGDILDRAILDRLVAEYEIDTIYHLAALLSTRAEFSPERAHRVNVEGMLELLKLASEQSQWRGRPVQFIFPSSIAAYGLPDRETKDRYARVREWEWNSPSTITGC